MTFPNLNTIDDVTRHCHDKLFLLYIDKEKVLKTLTDSTLLCPSLVRILRAVPFGFGWLFPPTTLGCRGLYITIPSLVSLGL